MYLAQHELESVNVIYLIYLYQFGAGKYVV